MKKQKVKSYINGGVIEGPKIGLIGQYENGNPKQEVIAPLSNLKLIIRTDEEVRKSRVSAYEYLIP